MSKEYDFVSTTNMLIINNDKLLVIKRSEKLENFPGWIMLPGGKQEKDETPQQATIRETFEETGVKAINPKLKVVATHNHFYRNRVYLVYIFVAKEFSGKLKDSKEGKALWMPLNKALNHNKLYPDLKRHVRLATDPSQEEVIFTYHKFNKDLEIIEKL